MAADLKFLSLNQIQNLAQSQQNHSYHNPMAAGSWVWNPNPQTQQHDDDSWEVKAFAEDTAHALGTTWPPRSYTCTFCRREFRSAQALGGHMNVHRRDRARLHQSHPSSSTTTTATVPLINPTSPSSSTQELVTNGGLCFLYQLPTTPNVVFTSPPINTCSMSPYPFNNLIAPPVLNTSSSSSSLRYPITRTEADADTDNINDGSNSFKEASTEELDLELRLGHRPTPS